MSTPAEQARQAQAAREAAAARQEAILHNERLQREREEAARQAAGQGGPTPGNTSDPENETDEERQYRIEKRKFDNAKTATNRSVDQMEQDPYSQPRIEDKPYHTFYQMVRGWIQSGLDKAYQKKLKLRDEDPEVFNRKYGEWKEPVKPESMTRTDPTGQQDPAALDQPGDRPGPAPGGPRPPGGGQPPGPSGADALLNQSTQPGQPQQGTDPNANNGNSGMNRAQLANPMASVVSPTHPTQSRQEQQQAREAAMTAGRMALTGGM